MALSNAKQPSPSNQSVAQQQANDAADGVGVGGTGTMPSSNSIATSKPPPPPGEAAASASGAANLKKPPPPAAPSSAAASAAASPPAPPTYLDSERSEHYVLGKSLLNDGDFENALRSIEEGMQWAKDGLQVAAAGGAAGTPSTSNDKDIELHEAMAPFYYLYGTTLLYSIEESPDQGGDQNVTNMTTTTSAAAAASSGGGGNAEDDDEGATSAVAPNAGSDEDMEIAWENLETARAILESMVQKAKSSPGNDDDGKKKKLLLDLAQVHLREGDLQRLNGRYRAAIDDYESCLKLRLESKMLGQYDRKIADVHYNLGLVYMLHAVQESSGGGGAGDGGGRTAAAAATTTTPEQIREWKCKSFEHSLECAKTLCGQIAFLCDTEPSAFFDRAASNRPNYKTTGEDDGADEAKKSQIRASSELQNLRRHANELRPATFDSREETADLLGLLQEIQETIDEAETAQEGVQQVTQMKDEISKMASADAGEGCGDAAAGGGGATTTTGFSGSSNAFGSNAAAASTAVAQPLQVRKKKKRDADDAKLSAKDPSDGKRPAPSAE